MSEKDHEAQLALKDRINFPYLLANQILTVQKSILVADTSIASNREIREAIKCLVHLIPNTWKDKTFEDDFKKAEVTEKIDMRPRFCGLSASVKLCEELGLTPFKEKISFDYYEVFQACMDLLQRKQMLTKIQRVEKLEGIIFEELEDATILKS